MRIFVSGGGGFIGRNFVEAMSPHAEVLAPRSAELNLCDAPAVDAWFANQKRFNVLVHSATTPAHRAVTPAQNVADANLAMFNNLMRHRDKWERMILLTSGAVYDVTGPIENVSEAHFGQRTPGEPSGFSKFQIAKQIAHDPAIVELRPFGVFGKYELYNIRFISNAICKALFGLPITLRQNRAFSYIFIDDLVAAIKLLCEKSPPQTAYNLTHPEHCTLLGLAQTVQQLVNPAVEIQVAQPGMGLPYTGTSSLFRTHFPQLPFTPHATAIAQLAEWYRNNKHTLNSQLLLEDK